MKRIKNFCIEKLKEYKTKWRQIDSDDVLKEFSNWENELNSKSDVKSIYDYVYAVAKKMWEVSAWKWSIKINFFDGEQFLQSFGRDEYYQLLTDLINEDDQKLVGLEIEKDTFKSLAENYRLGLKGIIGDDLTNWETKITKVGINDKDITDLRKKITDLQTAKDNLDKELKNKQQQILDHRCDTPNNAELNQTKGELDKANKEITSLKKQLNNGPNNPLPNSPNDKEEERKEEQENNNLNLEQLKTKLVEKGQEIKVLKEQLGKTKQSDNHSWQKSNENSKLFLGIAVGILIIVVFKALTLIISKKKKKKTNSRTAKLINYARKESAVKVN